MQFQKCALENQWILLLVFVFTSFLVACSNGGGGGGRLQPGPPGSFRLLAPENLAEDESIGPTLSWTDAEGENTYTLQMATDSAFQAPLAFEVKDIEPDTTTIDLPPGSIQSGTTYYWRMIAVNSVGETYASNGPFTFSTIQGGSLIWEKEHDGTGFFGTPLAASVDQNAIYVVGNDNSLGDSDLQWRIEKRDVLLGEPYQTFGEQGAVVINPGNDVDTVSQIKIDNAFLYVVGNSTDRIDLGAGPQYFYSWRIEKRQLKDGTLVDSFGTQGSVSVLLEGTGEARALVSDGTGLYVSGRVGKAIRIEKRKVSDGSPLWVVESGSGTIVDSVVHDDALFLVGWANDEITGVLHGRVEKRFTADGKLDPDFATEGVLTIYSDNGYYFSTAVVSDGSAIYVSGTQNVDNDPRWRIEKRDAATGELISDFGDAGVLFVNPSPDYDEPENMVIDGGFLFIAGIDSTHGASDSQWRVEKRHADSGKLEPSFGIAGVFTINPSSSNDDVYGLAIDADSIYLAGNSRIGVERIWRIEKRVK